ncbi:MAG: hypothetical protein BGO31_13650 [Bacteroidetes bacterium 43-16]|nr:MAG: hypothetical protein BGO31_13650 [Bacteroidetes bacterium 43-16]
MKKLFIFAFAATALLASCNGAEGDKAETSEKKEVATQTGATYTVDTTASSLKWKAYHKGGLNPRFGILKGGGTVAVENGAITGGTYTVDMNSLTTDPAAVGASEGKKSTDLDGHLKNQDFFEVTKYPTAKFEITGVGALDTTASKSVVAGATNTVSGNLTIKDKTVNVKFPAKVAITDNEIFVESKFTINRQDWGLTYGTEGDPKDWGISQDVDIELNIKAKK